MSARSAGTGLHERPAQAGTSNGGVPARRAVIRWAWRMFRREWRQQLLVLALIMVALAATVIGAAVATDTPPPVGAGFGTAQDMATFPAKGLQLASQIASLQQRFGRVDVIENQTVAIPGSINTYDLRAQDPHGPFGVSMLSLVSGHYPAGPGQVAVTEGVASTFNLRIGDMWHQGGQVRQVTGIVANLTHAAAGRSWSGPIYVATPQLLQAFGIKASDVNPDADILTMRPGLSGISDMQLNYGNGNGPGGGHGPQDVGSNSYPCPKGECLANPVIQEVGALPSGTSAPNTVITEHAIGVLHLQASVSGWLIQAPHNPTAAQITDARLTASAAGMTIETKSSTPSSAEILDYATAFGIALALGILAMTIGLIRSETARDLRTLAATGASSLTRRELTAATAFALALGGAVLGTVAAYVAAIGYAWDNPLDGLSELSNVPAQQLLFIVVGMPVIAAVVGWLLAGREPSALSRQPLE